jgi:excisionase family DNA binding protein
MDDRWLWVEDIADYLGVSKDAECSWVSTKGMPSPRVGRLWRVQRDEVDVWMRADEAARSEKEHS